MYSFAGNKNFGDDYIASEWIRFNKKSGYGKQILFSSDSTWLQSYHMQDGAIFNNVLPAIIHQHAKEMRENLGVERLSVAQYIECGNAAADFLIESDQWRGLIRNIVSLQACGGGYVNQIFPQVYSVVSMMKRLGERLAVPLYGTGLGLCPMDTTDSAITSVFEGFERIECRDRESLNALNETGGKIASSFGCDDTFLTPVRYAQQPTRKPTLFINIQSDSNAHLQSEILNRVQNLAGQLKDTHTVNYIHFFQRSDARFLSALKNVVDISAVYSKDQLYAGGLPFQQGDICVSSRFHLHMLASRLGAKGAYVSGRPGYYDIKHRSVVDLGSNWIDLMDESFVPESILSQSAPEMDECSLMMSKRALATEILMN
ncbi:polysaccharide pyruvyl transferase family protein [Paracoccus litorisediminis]|uniref:Polysaccharide pyruvyl transferase domain-containing protein n=1 Tax=Paracoccus litorisediminis TaxID=2006130 RepID=A0A844HSX2_9RHOB|nr:polysaccharide pyruvyl transferase family protein [Paracoccus litorisediminis]MTH62198.1 hypothetical protein [Paracoccus litorisediminis]